MKIYISSIGSDCMSTVLTCYDAIAHLEPSLDRVCIYA